VACLTGVANIVVEPPLAFPCLCQVHRLGTPGTVISTCCSLLRVSFINILDKEFDEGVLISFLIFSTVLIIKYMI